MFREMRRKRQLLTDSECEDILNNGTSGVLAVSGDNGYPYTVPLSYVYDNNRIYFHSANEGHKIDAVKRNPKASFCIICQDIVVPQKYTTYFKSVTVFGEINILDNNKDKMEAITKLAAKYAPLESESSRLAEIEHGWKNFCILCLSIKHISGKKAKELRENI